MAIETLPTELYIGKRDAIIAEVGGLSHIYEGKYLLAPYGEASYDCAGADTLKGAKELLAEYRAWAPAARVIWL